jgi:hypothetical protein
MAMVAAFPVARQRRTRSAATRYLKRPLGDKLQEIARLSPSDLRDIEALADIVLHRLKRRQVS